MRKKFQTRVFDIKNLHALISCCHSMGVPRIERAEVEQAHTQIWFEDSISSGASYMAYSSAVVSLIRNIHDSGSGRENDTSDHATLLEDRDRSAKFALVQSAHEGVTSVG